MCLFKKSVFIFFLFFSLASAAQDPHPLPVADYQVNNLCFKSITNFSNTSIHLQNPAYLWTIWQMGNSVPIYTSSAININFQFPAKTTYTVLLSVINYVTPTHTHSDQVQRTIVIDSIPIADFDLKSCTSNFTNLSCCSNSFIWDFGDSTPTSTLTSPVHTYTAYNNYTVTLISSNGLLSDTISKVVAPYPNTLTGNFKVVDNPDTVRFNVVLPTLNDSLKGA